MLTTTPDNNDRDFRLESRALAAYYRSGGRAHPDHNLTEFYIIDSRPMGTETESKMVCGREYIRLANHTGTLAIFYINKWDDVKRLKKGPRSVQNGTAQTKQEFDREWDAAMEEFYRSQPDSCDDGLNSIIDELDYI